MSERTRWLVQWRVNADDPWRDLAMGTISQMHDKLDRLAPLRERRNYRVIRRTVTELVLAPRPRLRLKGSAS